MTKLKSLTLNECQIDSEIFDQLMHVTRVKSLVFNGGPKLSPQQLKVIAGSRRLTTLTISSAILSKDDLKALASISSLETLCLKHSLFNSDDLKALTALVNLRDLDIGLTNVDDNYVDKLPQFSKLERLVIGLLSAAREARSPA